MQLSHVNTDQSISFFYNGVTSGRVEVAGTFSNWELVQMQKIDNDLWTYRTSSLVSGKQYYKFIISGRWIKDPLNLLFDNASGDSILHVKTGYGSCFVNSFFSSALSSVKAYSVYFPPSYFFSPKRSYPTLYLMGGLFDYELSWVKEGKVVSIADTLIRGGDIEDMIIIMPDKDDTCFIDGDWVRYSAYITRDLLNHCEQEYRCESNQRKRGLEGLSLGASWALRLGINHSHIFSSISALSGFFPKDAKIYLEDNLSEVQANHLRFRLFCGNKETELLSHLSWMSRWITGLGIYCEFYQGEGIHRWPLWQRALPNSLIFHNFSFTD